MRHCTLGNHSFAWLGLLKAQVTNLLIGVEQAYCFSSKSSHHQ